MKQSIDVQDFINKRPLSAYQWLILLICTVVAAVDGIDVAVIGFIVPSLTHEWGVTKAAMGSVIGIGLFGLAIGSLCAGPLADRYGRKTMLMAAMLLCGLGSLGCASADTLASLTVWRFLTGLGMGAALPSATTILAEYTPERDRARFIAVMLLGFTLGSAGVGFIAAAMLPTLGWKGILVLCGVLPLLMFALVAWTLPESARFMVVRQQAGERIARALRRISGVRFEPDAAFTLPEMKPNASRSSVGTLFSNGMGLGTLMLWAACFMGLLVIYLLSSWLPTLIKDSGQPMEKAATVAAGFMLGGALGGLAVGWVMDKTKPHYAVAVAYLIGAAIVFVIGKGVSSLAVLQALVFLAGFFTTGSQTSICTLAAAFYPTQGRATGVAWMLGIGRFGAITGATSGGLMLGAGWGIGSVFAALAVPGLLAGVAIAIKGLRYGDSQDAALGGAGTYAH
ncbi:MAG: MFS transporter [Burkholderiales bacterium]|nr:MFS transporter [Burkholderiales bacterium]MDE1925591.1 MFS transporter [Burkholderiales bacterium]MDE2160002.1 MFS transporter [Burkholderiales bacterium]MDE2503248.1 MFS transporter [Burkholderiales bacterium]